MKVFSRVGAAGVVVAMVMGLTALPVSAGGGAEVTVTGVATCNLETGHETWTLEWTVANVSPEMEVRDLNGPAGFGLAIDITAAEQSGAWTGPIATIVGETVSPGDWVTGSDGPVPNDVEGDVILTVDYDYFGGEVSGQAVGAVALDGSCEADPTTTTTTTTSVTPTTAAAAADAVRVVPTFTG